ncbi:hypothetical protein TCON_0494 [Astathelohania contejeani]|uniref:Uncharacterized protein n=1 Tax=Astathelohania contejeani TaxID=164912 RepID=A0ABQ7I1H5_9MICR|nr:hypothetical protein TCON_0494 [Thelohania contejeani]
MNIKQFIMSLSSIASGMVATVLLIASIIPSRKIVDFSGLITSSENQSFNMNLELLMDINNIIESQQKKNFIENIDCSSITLLSSSIKSRPIEAVKNLTYTTISNDKDLFNDITKSYGSICITNFEDIIEDLKSDPEISIADVMKNNNSIEKFWIKRELYKRKYVHKKIYHIFTNFKSILTNIKNNHISNVKELIKNINTEILIDTNKEQSKLHILILDAEYAIVKLDEDIKTLSDQLTNLHLGLNFYDDVIIYCDHQYKIWNKHNYSKKNNEEVVKEMMKIAAIIRSTKFNFIKKISDMALNSFYNLENLINKSKNTFVLLKEIKSLAKKSNINLYKETELSINKYIEMISSYECHLNNNRHKIESLNNIIEIQKQCIINKNDSINDITNNQMQNLDQLKPKAKKEFEKISDMIKKHSLYNLDKYTESRNQVYYINNSIYFAGLFFPKDNKNEKNKYVQIKYFYHLDFAKLIEEDENITIKAFLSYFINNII